MISFYAMKWIIVALCAIIKSVQIHRVHIMSKASVKPVLLSKEQYESLLAIQKSEREKSPLGIAPSVHEIARGLVSKALSSGDLFKTASI